MRGYGLRSIGVYEILGAFRRDFILLVVVAVGATAALVGVTIYSSGKESGRAFAEVAFEAPMVEREQFFIDGTTVAQGAARAYVNVLLSDGMMASASRDLGTTKQIPELSGTLSITPIDDSAVILIEATGYKGDLSREMVDYFVARALEPQAGALPDSGDTEVRVTQRVVTPTTVEPRPSVSAMALLVPIFGGLFIAFGLVLAKALFDPRVRSIAGLLELGDGDVVVPPVVRTDSLERPGSLGGAIGALAVTKGESLFVLDGKSDIALSESLASQLAASGRSVLLVGRQDAADGGHQVGLAGAIPSARPSTVVRAWPDSGDLLADSAELSRRLVALGESFDVIVMAATEMNDEFSWSAARASGKVVLSVRLGSTRRTDFGRTLAQFTEVGVTPSFVVCSQ